MDTKRKQGLFIAGGVCAILWPLLSLGFYAAYPVAASGPIRTLPGGPAAFAARWAELGQRPAVVALEWSQAAVPLLLWPFLLAICRLLSRQGQRDLTLVAIGLGLLGMSLMVLSGTFHPTLSHALGQTYVEAGSEAEGAAILSIRQGLLHWYRGLNQTAALLYQGCVGLVGLALIRSRTWQGWGWLGLVGSLLALALLTGCGGGRIPTSEPGAVRTREADGVEMVWVPGGMYTIGLDETMWTRWWPSAPTAVVTGWTTLAPNTPSTWTASG